MDAVTLARQDDLEAVGADGDALCAIVASHADALRTASLGKTFQIDDASFRLFGMARNTIYRVSRNGDWFLKLTRVAHSTAMLHEQAGARAIDGTLARLAPSYRGAALTRVDLEHAFVLASRIPGQPLNRAFLKRCWISWWPLAAPSLESVFQTFGGLVAIVHGRAPVTPDVPPATTRPFDALRGLLVAARNADRVVGRLARWYEAEKRPDDGVVFIHGNLRLDNVLCDGQHLGFLDFENCGTGSEYQDLSRPVAELLLTRTLAVFPRERVDRCILGFLRGYREVRPYDPGELWAFVRARIFRYHLETRAKGRFAARIGGVPIVRKRLHQLTCDVLERDLQSVVTGAGAPPL